jgi:hypothetical protein
VIRVREPSTGDIHNIATLSGTATQYSFPYLPYVDDGSVMMGIMGTNEYGSTTSRTLVYMTNTNTWY